MAQLPVVFPVATIATLNANFPPSGSSNHIGDRAVEIVRQYFAITDPGSIFNVINANSSLCRVTLTNGTVKEFLVKGTADTNFVFQQMKIAGQTIYDRLTASGAFAGQPRLPIYRVRDVNSNSPTIWEVYEGTDFSLVPEPRWTGR